MRKPTPEEEQQLKTKGTAWGKCSLHKNKGYQVLMDADSPKGPCCFDCLMRRAQEELQRRYHSAEQDTDRPSQGRR